MRMPKSFAPCSPVLQSVRMLSCFAWPPLYCDAGRYHVAMIKNARTQQMKQLWLCDGEVL